MGNPKTKAQTLLCFILLFSELETGNGKNNTTTSRKIDGGFVTLNYDVN